MNKTRLDALSDGVLAIVMTILILEFKVPKIDTVEGSKELIKDFIHNFPVLLSYIISFLVLIVWWMSHHQLFHAVKQVNRKTIFLNGIFLMCIAFIPYPTALIGEYPSLYFPAVLYGAVSLCCGASYYGLYHHILRRNADHPFNASPASFAFKNTWLHLLIYILAMGIAFVSPYISVAIYAAVPIYFFLKKNV